MLFYFFVAAEAHIRESAGLTLVLALELLLTLTFDVRNCWGRALESLLSRSRSMRRFLG